MAVHGDMLGGLDDLIGGGYNCQQIFNSMIELK
jgi:hypothetical protein